MACSFLVIIEFSQSVESIIGSTIIQSKGTPKTAANALVIRLAAIFAFRAI